MKAEQFEFFWSTYPRRIGKGAARKSFEKALKLATFEEIMAGLRGQLSYYSAKEQQFIPHPSTWLNQERWADDPQPSRPQPMQRRQGNMGDFAREFLERYDAKSGVDRRDDQGTQHVMAHLAPPERH